MANTGVKPDEHDQLLAQFRENPDSLVVCPICDKIYEAPRGLNENQVAHCVRCHTAIAYPEHVKVEHTIALSITSMLLMLGSISYEFLGVSETGFSNQVSLAQVLTSFNHGPYILLGIFVGAFVIGLPLVRALTLIYVLWPLMQEWEPFPHARTVFTFSQRLGPWLMTEIFIIGVMVALVKMVAMATVEFGASFWIYCLLVLCMALMNATVHRKAVWDLLREREP